MKYFALLLLFATHLLHAQTISLSFDDGFDPRQNQHAAHDNAAILQALKTAGVHATIFPTGRNVDSPEGLALVRAWGEAGHLVGNHTYSHQNYGNPRISTAAFTTDILREQALTGDFPGSARLLRFPYLKEGETRAKYQDLRQWMNEHQFRAAPVSIDCSDWYYNERFLAWQTRHPDADLQPFRDAYLAHLWDRANYYDTLARTVLGRAPAHAILLHTNAINATFLADVIAMFRQRGWQIVDTRTTLQDPLYTIEATTIPAGESIVWSLAKAQGHAGLRYPAEDGPYEAPRLDALGL